MSDTKNGDLKYDLTTAFEDEDINLPSLGSGLPTLELLRSYYRLKDDEALLDSDGQTITPRVQTGTEHGVNPVLILFRGNFGIVPGQNGTPILPEEDVSAPANAFFTMRPVVILANPHNVDLAPANYELVWEMEKDAAPLYYSIGFSPNHGSGFSVVKNLKPLELLGGQLVLKMDDVAFKAGEVKVFTLANNGFEKYNGSARLENNYDPTRFLYVNTGEPIPPSCFNSSTGLLDWDNVEIRQRLGYVGNNAQPPTFTRFSLKLNDSDASVYESVTVGNRYPLGMRTGGRYYVPLRDALDYGYHARFQARPSHSKRSNYPDSGEISNDGADTRGLPWLANANIRSPRTRSIKDVAPGWNSHPHFHWHGHWTGYTNSGPQSSNWRIALADTNGTQSTWAPVAPGLDDGQAYLAFFHIPRSPLLSLGQLQHVNAFTEDALIETNKPGAASPEYAGSYSVGHSWANLFVPFDQKDFNYLLNEAIWDKYFFSGYVNNRFLNPRIQPLYPDQPLSDDPATMAGHVMINGPFNVNSTSVESWIAVLSSLHEQDVDYLDVEKGMNRWDKATDMSQPVLRSPIPGGDHTNPWNGFRNLSQTQIRNLAGQIVHQIRQRGPFLSLADFVNRSIPDSDTPTNTNLFAPHMMGALQAAIDNNQKVTVDGVVYDPTGINQSMQDPMTGTKTNPLPNDAAGNNLSLNRAAPGYLTQADLLNLLGSFITVRSDTFKIRAYGDSINPLTGKVEGKAWCEAIVQRMPDEVGNANVGRAFHVVAFKWLSADEL